MQEDCALGREDEGEARVGGWGRKGGSHRLANTAERGGSPTATCCLNCCSECAAISLPWSSSDFECGEIHALNLAGGGASTVSLSVEVGMATPKVCFGGKYLPKGREAALTFDSHSVHPHPAPGHGSPLMPSHTRREAGRGGDCWPWVAFQMLCLSNPILSSVHMITDLLMMRE